MKISAFLVVAAVLSMPPARADAQQIQLQIQDGRVTLDAQNVPVRQILAEWSRIGGAKIVNAEKIVGVPVTLQLDGVSERQALDTILRNVSGYMLAARQPGNTGASAFDRILILPTSAAPRNPPPPTNTFANPGLNRPMPMVQPQPATSNMDPDDDPEGDQPDVSDAEDANAPMTQPGVREKMQRVQQLRNGTNPAGGQPRMQMPQMYPQGPGDYPNMMQPGVAVQPIGTQPSVVAPGPGNPFGIPAGASSVPGVVTPVPQVRTPEMPVTPTAPRPPR